MPFEIYKLIDKKPVDPATLFRFLENNLTIQKEISINFHKQTQTRQRRSPRNYCYGASFTAGHYYPIELIKINDNSASSSDEIKNHICFSFNTLCKQIDPGHFQLNFFSATCAYQGGFAQLYPLIGAIRVSKYNIRQLPIDRPQIIKIQPLQHGDLESEYYFSNLVAPFLAFEPPITTPDAYFGVMDHLDGEDLFTLLSDEDWLLGLGKVKRMTLTHELIFKLLDMHQSRIIHCDIKPENIIFNLHHAENEIIHYIDYGKTLKLPPHHYVNRSHHYGTSACNALEVLINSSYQTQKRDVFALGRVLQLLWGCEKDESFTNDQLSHQARITHLRDLHQKIASDEYSMIYTHDLEVTNGNALRNLISNMLHYNSDLRYSMTQVVSAFLSIEEAFNESQLVELQAITRTNSKPSVIERIADWISNTLASVPLDEPQEPPHIDDKTTPETYSEQVELCYQYTLRKDKRDIAANMQPTNPAENDQSYAFKLLQQPRRNKLSRSQSLPNISIESTQLGLGSK